MKWEYVIITAIVVIGFIAITYILSQEQTPTGAVTIPFITEQETQEQEGISAQAVQTECRNRCNAITNTMSTDTSITASGAISSTDFTDVANNFCRAKFNIINQGERYCDAIYACVVTFADQTSCQIKCNSDTHTVSNC